MPTTQTTASPLINAKIKSLSFVRSGRGEDSAIKDLTNIMITFKNTREFNKAWNYFEEKYKRQKFRMPKVKETDNENFPDYLETERFKFCAKTFKMWIEFCENEWEKIKNSVPETYATKHILLFVKEKFEQKTKKLL